MNKAPEAAITVTASLNTRKRQKRHPVHLIIKFIIVLSGCLGSVFSFLSCFSVGAASAAVVIPAVIACAVFTFSLNIKPSLSGKVSAGAAAVFLALTFIFRDGICAGMANTVNIYLNDIREQFRDEPFIPLAEPELAGYHTGVFFAFLTVFLCMTAAYISSKNSCAACMCFPLLALPAAAMMFGLEPDYTAFGAVAAACAAAIAFEVSSPDRPGSGHSGAAVVFSGLTAAVLAAACFGVIVFSVRSGGYSRSEDIDKLYDSITGHMENGDIQSAISEIVTVTVKKSIHTGAINHGKLGEFGEISFDNEAVLQVTIPKSDETIYLRGFVGSVYTGRSWERLPTPKQRQLNSITNNFTVEGLSPLLLDGYNLKLSSENLPRYKTGLPKQSFSVKNISAGRDYLYMPYNLVPESVSHYAIQGDSSFRGGESSYLGQFYNPVDYYGYQILFLKKWSIPAALTVDEGMYRNFVYENYTDIPESFASAEKIFNEDYYRYITAEDGQTGKSTLSEITVFNRKLYYIKKWLRENCEYSLSAGRLPAGSDFVNYFLEKRKGSCSHFASAAAIMCRYAGIPARYVEGYVIKPGDFPSGTKTGEIASVDVTDARGHAWVEIYIDGFGWYPVEFTSGYGNVRTAIPTESAAVESEPESDGLTGTESASVTEPPENTVNSTEASDTDTAAVSAAEQQEQTDAGAPETTTLLPSEDQALPEEGSKSVGFGIFGIKGSKHVDIYYDLTPAFWTVLGIALILLLTVLRRTVLLALYRRKCASGKKAAAFAAYKKLNRLVRIMKLPEQGSLDYGEYTKIISDGSPLLKDGTAGTVIGAALKASFSGGQLTADEAKAAVSAVDGLADRYCGSLDKLGKIKLKYFYCIV